jgi:adenylate kinase
MRIVFLGAPGSGKGTQAALLRDHFGVAHISTGELLRAQVAAGTPLGKQAQIVMARGDLVSNEIVLGMLETRLREADAQKGFILDGYPRNLAQCESLDQLLLRLGMPVEKAVQLDVDENTLLHRLAERGRKEGRADDTPESIKNRLVVYQQQTAPVIDYFRSHGKLINVMGEGAIEAIEARILAALKAA